jgi:hypothetical protein
VQIALRQKPLTAGGGACSVVAKFLERIRFRHWVRAHVPVQERSPNAKGIDEQVLPLLVTSLTGGTRFSHLAWWGHGWEAWKAGFGVAWLPQAARVLTRFLGQFRQRDNEALRAAAVGLAGQRIPAEGISEEVLILDSTVCERSGRQQGARQSDNPRKPGRPTHHPLKAALGSGYGLNLGNRRGDTHSAHPCLGFYEQTRRELPDMLRIPWVLVDSGFGEEGFLEHLEVQHQRYIVALRLTAYVQRAIRGSGQCQWLDRGLEVAEVRVALRRGKGARRLIVIRPHEPRRPRAGGK